MRGNGRSEKFSMQDQQMLESDVIDLMACEGLRTIGIAYKDFLINPTDSNQVIRFIIL